MVKPMVIGLYDLQYVYMKFEIPSKFDYKQIICKSWV
jgi:hypothetical protein